MIALGWSGFLRSDLSPVAPSCLTLEGGSYPCSAPQPGPSMWSDFSETTQALDWASEVKWKSTIFPRCPMLYYFARPLCWLPTPFLPLEAVVCRRGGSHSASQLSCGAGESLSQCGVKVEELGMLRLSTLQCGVLWISPPFDCSCWCIQARAFRSKRSAVILSH